jgi:hypothetical protein
MVAVPAGIVFVNSDISDSVKDKLITQLFIDYVLTGDEFDAMIVADPTYPAKIKQFRKRTLVIRTYAQGNIVNNIPNRSLADILLFVANGMANMLTNCGHSPSFPVVSVTWGDFGVF